MRYLIGFLVTIGLIILLIVLLLSGGGNKAKVPNTPKTLESYYNTDAIARLTIDGPINADIQHQQVRITVGRDDTLFQQIQGYQGTVVNSQNYANNASSYSAFLNALARANFTKGSTSTALGDESGYCSLGDRYILEFIQNGQDLERFWSTSCGGSLGTYAGNLGLTMSLFKAQVPDYSTLTENVIF